MATTVVGMENPCTDDLSASRPTVVKVSTPADVLGVLPHRLGFHPTESLVAISLHGPRGRDELVMRFDLPQRDVESALMDDLVGRLLLTGADNTLVVCYTDAARTPGGLPRAPMIRSLRRRLKRAGIGLHDALVVSGGRWWSYLCRDELCCPPGGTPLPEHPTPAATSYAAESVARGSAVLDDRDALTRSIEPLTDVVAARGEVEAVADGPGDDCAAAHTARLVERWAVGDCDLSDADIRLVATGLRSAFSRDYVLTLVLEHPPEVLVGIFTELARRTPDRDGAPVCAALAWFAHGAGDGALAIVAAERALRCQPGYYLAELVLDSLAAMQPPRVVREVSADVRAALVSIGEDSWEELDDGASAEPWDEVG